MFMSVFFATFRFFRIWILFFDFVLFVVNKHTSGGVCIQVVVIFFLNVQVLHACIWLELYWWSVRACVCMYVTMFALVLVLAQYSTVVFRRVHKYAQVTDHRHGVKYGYILLLFVLNKRAITLLFRFIVLLALSVGFFLEKAAIFLFLTVFLSFNYCVSLYSSNNRIISISSFSTTICLIFFPSLSLSFLRSTY